MHNPTPEGRPASRAEDQQLHPRRPGLVLALVLVAMGAGSALAIWMHAPTEAAYVGYLQVAAKPITAGRDARIAKVLVQEGQLVEAGAPLFVLSDARLESDRALAERTVQRLDAELSQAQARAVVELQWRLDELDQDIFESRLKSAKYLQEKLAHEVERIARKELLKEFDNPFRQKTVQGQIRQIGQDERSIVDEKARVDTMLKVHESENAIEVAAAQIEMCDSRVAEMEKLKAELPDKVRLSMGIHVAEARLAEAQDALQQLEESQAELTLRAELPGTIGAMTLQPGDAVTATEPLVEILDADHRYLIVHVRSTDIDQFAKGTELDLEFPNSVHRLGRVVKTSTKAVPADAEAGACRISQIAVHIEPAGKIWPEVPYGTTIKVRPED